MKLSHFFLGIIFLPVSCSNKEQANNNEHKVDESLLQGDYDFKTKVRYLSDEDMALDALNELQVNGDGKMMLYMTFPNIHHSECVGEVELMKISRAEFKEALLKVMSINNIGISAERQLELATLASKPDSTYMVNICGADHINNNDSSSVTAPMSGTWIISAIFGTSDLLINW